MKQDFKDALVLALSRRDAPADGKWLTLNAEILPDIDPAWRDAMTCEQGFRPEFLKLEKNGYQTSPVIGKLIDCAGAIVLAGRNRKVNEYNVLRAYNACTKGGSILISGDKKAGIAALRKWTASQFEISDSFSKYHAVVFEIKRTGDAAPLPSLEVPHEEFLIAEGMFSSDGPDIGSQILAEHFDKRIKGCVADFGAGWGYLSNQLLQASDRVEELDLFEADYASLEAAKTNVKNESVKLSFNWCDLVSEFKKKPRHWVIMNPPFHSGRATDPELGKKFIQVAASTLPSGGRLLMVANRNLPYEDTLSKCFKRFETLETRDGFKVIEAVR